MSSPVVDSAGTIFFGAQDERLYAVSPKGRVQWTVELPADVDSTPLILEGGQLVVGCDDGTLRAFGAKTTRDPRPEG